LFFCQLVTRHRSCAFLDAFFFPFCADRLSWSQTASHFSLPCVVFFKVASPPPPSPFNPCGHPCHSYLNKKSQPLYFQTDWMTLDSFICAFHQHRQCSVEHVVMFIDPNCVIVIRMNWNWVLYNYNGCDFVQNSTPDPQLGLRGRKVASKLEILRQRGQARTDTKLIYNFERTSKLACSGSSTTNWNPSLS